MAKHTYTRTSRAAAVLSVAQYVGDSMPQQGIHLPVAAAQLTGCLLMLCRRLDINCTNSEPCPPVDCAGVWLPAGPCDGPCGGGGAGLRPERFNITTQARQNCCWQPHLIQLGGCSTTPMCLLLCPPQAAYGGANCSAEQDETRLITSCFNTTPCPIDCVGSWSINGACGGACGGFNGTWPETYTVTTAAQWGGQPCPFVHGATQSILECTNEAPCPVPCHYTWVENGNCTGGFLPDVVCSEAGNTSAKRLFFCRESWLQHQVAPPKLLIAACCLLCRCLWWRQRHSASKVHHKQPCAAWWHLPVCERDNAVYRWLHQH